MTCDSVVRAVDVLTIFRDFFSPKHIDDISQSSIIPTAVRGMFDEEKKRNRTQEIWVSWRGTKSLAFLRRQNIMAKTREVEAIWQCEGRDFFRAGQSRSLKPNAIVTKFVPRSDDDMITC